MGMDTKAVGMVQGNAVRVPEPPHVRHQHQTNTKEHQEHQEPSHTHEHTHEHEHEHEHEHAHVEAGPAVILALRLPGGGRIQESFPLSTKVKAVQDFVRMKLEGDMCTKPGRLMVGVPQRALDPLKVLCAHACTHANL